MRHRVTQRKLGRDTGHRLALIRNLMTELLRHERIQTTDAKARELRREVEKLITLAKDGSLHHRRLAMGRLFDESVAHKLFEEIAPRYKDRPGGYTRLVKAGFRRGDGAPMAVVELVR